jgi:hypothetical protein
MMTARNWSNQRVDAGRLIDFLISLPPEHVCEKALAPGVCMNPSRPCGSCAFNQSHLSRYCLPAERQAKRAYDLQHAEVAA